MPPSAPERTARPSSPGSGRADTPGKEARRCCQVRPGYWASSSSSATCCRATTSRSRWPSPAGPGDAAARGAARRGTRVARRTSPRRSRRPSACASSTSPRPAHPDAALDGARRGRPRVPGDRRRLRRHQASSSRSPTRVTTPRCRPSGQATGYEIVPAAAGRYEIQHAIDSVFGPAVPAARRRRRAATRTRSRTRSRASTSTTCSKKVLEQQRLGPPPHRRQPAGDPRARRAARRSTGIDALSGSQIREMIYAILTQKQREKFENELELDCSYSLPGQSRFRVNVFLQRDSVGAVMRAIPYEIVPFDNLGVPDIGAGVRRAAPRPRARHRARPAPARARRSRR